MRRPSPTSVRSFKRQKMTKSSHTRKRVAHHGIGDKRKHSRTKITKKLGRFAKLEAKVKELRKDTDNGLSTLTSRTMKFQDLQVIKTVGIKQETANYAAVGHENYKDALEAVTIYDETSKTFVVSDWSANGLQAFEIAYRNSEIVIKNMEQNDCNVRVYLCTPKGGCTLAPNQAWENGVTETHVASSVIRAGLSSLYANNIMSHPTDSHLFETSWRILDSHKEKMNPGETMRWKTPHHLNVARKWDVQRDTEGTGDTYQIGDLYWLVTLNGGIMMDSSTKDVQQGTAKIGLSISSTVIIEYNSGGPKRKSFHYAQGNGTEDGGGVFVNDAVGTTEGGNVITTNTHD